MVGGSEGLSSKKFWWIILKNILSIFKDFLCFNLISKNNKIKNNILQERKNQNLKVVQHFSFLFHSSKAKSFVIKFSTLQFFERFVDALHNFQFRIEIIFVGQI